MKTTVFLFLGILAFNCILYPLPVPLNSLNVPLNSITVPPQATTRPLIPQRNNIVNPLPGFNQGWLNNTQPRPIPPVFPNKPAVVSPNINIYGGYGYSGYGYDYPYGYYGGYVEPLGALSYATINMQQGTAPTVWCKSECPRQQGKNWTGNSYCDNSQCYCECSNY